MRMDVDLGRGQADSGRRVHGFKHISDEITGLVRHLGDRFCPCAQPGIGKFQYVENCHGIVVLFQVGGTQVRELATFILPAPIHRRKLCLLYS